MRYNKEFESSCETGQTVSQQPQIDTLELWQERPYVKPQSKSQSDKQKNTSSNVNGAGAGIVVIYFNYFMFWTFSITDSFIRFVPLLMFIAFLNDVMSQFASFFIFCIIFCAIFAFEAHVLMNEKIIEQRTKSADNENRRKNNNTNRLEAKPKQDSHVDGLIYSFYCVITGSLYLLVFIKVPYLNFNVTNASFFQKYQLIRIFFSVFLLILLYFVQLIMHIWYYNWIFLCVLLFLLFIWRVFIIL